MLQSAECGAAIVSVFPLSPMWGTNNNKYLHTPWSRVILEKLASLQLVKKFPAFYGTRRFLTALKRPPPVPILSQTNAVLIP